MSIERMVTLVTLMAVGVFITSCQEQANVEQSPGPAAKAEIDWYQGSVEAAFLEAKKSQTPVYLYWGAVWCPPCQEIKHTVFKSKQFIAQSELFIPVYLDGDTERAQVLGENFGVKGYPTMIVFSPDGDEITRIPGGIDVSRYNTVLALSLNNMRPTSMLVDLALNEPAELKDADLRQLAYYSWGQDFDALPEGSSASIFLKLSTLAKGREPESSARLYMQYLAYLDETASEDQGPATAVDHTPLLGILESPELTLACWDSLAYHSEEILGVLSLEDMNEDQLKTKWRDAMLALRHHRSLSTAERLGAWFPLLTFFFEVDGDERLSDDTLARIREDAESANTKTRNRYERQSVVNQLNHLYQAARLNDDARNLLVAELERSASPYYFMSSLSSLSEKEGKVDEAVAWRRKAYESSKGAATRFQWGANYVRTLIRLQPDNHEAIANTSLALFDDLQGKKETFAGRNFRILQSLSTQLKEWQGMQEITSLAFHMRLSSMCNDQTLDSLEQKNCQMLL